MGRYLLRVLKAMLVSSLGIGGGVGLLVLIFVLTNKNEPNAFHYGLVAGLVFGLIAAVFMVAVLLPLDLSAHVFLPKGRYKQIWELEQTREFEVDGTAKEMLHASRQALLVVPYVTAVSDDIEHMLTRAVTGPSWRSGGEELEVEINPVGAHRWNIKATSKPKGNGVVFDYGKNFENLETWMNQFLEIVQAKGENKDVLMSMEKKPEIKAEKVAEVKVENTADVKAQETSDSKAETTAAAPVESTDKKV
jgi:hypothetical protein